MAAALVATVLGACASSSNDKVSCASTDWFEIGRRDGAQGNPMERLRRHKATCHKEFNETAETLYLNGRNRGLVEYCSRENGFQMGKMGLTYFYVCPSTAEQDFLKAYEKGRQARDIEIKNRELDAQIDTLFDRLNGRQLTQDERSYLSRELSKLKVIRAQNDRELNRIVTQTL